MLEPVEFHGQALTVVDRNGEPYVAMKPVVEGMGLAWQPQHRKFSEDGERWGITMMVIPSQGGEQTTVCIPLRKLTGWLMTLQISRMDPEVAAKVLVYQNECDDALWSYWSKAMREPQVMANTKSTDIQPFSFENHPVRIVLDEKGEPWWAAKDIGAALGYAESTDANKLTQSVPDDWKGRKPIPTPGGMQEVHCLSEQGLYFFLARSDKPTALPFQRWIAGDVLPSIRRTGTYSAIPEDPTEMGLPDFRVPTKAARAWIEQVERAEAAEAAAVQAQAQVRQLTAQVDQDAPRVAFAERVEASPTTHLVGAVAKMIQQGTGIAMGQNRLFVWLRENRYLHQTGSRTNQPTQRSLDAGWFVLQVRNVGMDAETRVTYTTRVTGKGLLHLYEQFYAMAVAMGLTPHLSPRLVTSAEVLRQLPLWEDEDRDGVDERLVAAARQLVLKA
jgi:anti-repressor protein